MINNNFKERTIGSIYAILLGLYLSIIQFTKNAKNPRSSLRIRYMVQLFRSHRIPRITRILVATITLNVFYTRIAHYGEQ